MKRTLLTALAMLGLASGVLAQSERSYDNQTIVVALNDTTSTWSLSRTLEDLNFWLNDDCTEINGVPNDVYPDGTGSGLGGTLTSPYFDTNGDIVYQSIRVWAWSDPFFDEIFGYRLIRLTAYIDVDGDCMYTEGIDTEVILDDVGVDVVKAIKDNYNPQDGGGPVIDEKMTNDFGASEQAPVNDPLFQGGFQKNLSIANFPAAWAANATGSAGVRIGVVDTGYENGFLSFLGSHQDLNGKVVAEVNFRGFFGLFNAQDVDPLSHGTRVAGLAGAQTNNALGIASTGYETSLVIAAAGQRSNAIGSGVTLGGGPMIFSTMLGIFWCHTFFDTQIINVSSSFTVTPLQRFIGTLVLNWVTRGNGFGGSGLPGSLVIAASGFTGNGAANANVLRWPASEPQVMAVGGTTNVAGKFANGELTEAFLTTSRLGNKVEASAAARLLNSTENGNIFSVLIVPFFTGIPYNGDLSGYTATAGPTFPDPNPLAFDRFQGTSFAAPQVSGLAGLVWAYASNPFDVPSLNLNPFTTAAYVRSRVSRNTDNVQNTAAAGSFPVGRSAGITGRINAGRSVAYVDRILLPTQNTNISSPARLGTTITARIVLDRIYTTDQTVRVLSSNPGLARPTLTTVKIRAGQAQANCPIAIARSFNAPLTNNRQKVEIYADFRGTRQVGQLYIIR